MDRLNNLQRREWYEEYFSAVDVPQIERDKRVQLAEDIDDAYDGLFDLIAVMTVMNQEMDREYLTGYLQTRIADVGNGSDYLNEYAIVTARDVVNTTLDHEGEEWYTSEDRTLLLSAGDAQTIGNYEQFEKAVKDGKTHKIWKCKLLKGSREKHKEKNGEKIPIMSKFVFPDCEMLFPGDVVNGTAKQNANCKCTLDYEPKIIDNQAIRDIMELFNGLDYETVEEIANKPENKEARDRYLTNLNNIPNMIDYSLTIEEQSHQAFELRNQYKREARDAMLDRKTAEMLDREKPLYTYEGLLADKMKRKGLTREEAVVDILKTATKSNSVVNKGFNR